MIEDDDVQKPKSKVKAKAVRKVSGKAVVRPKKVKRGIPLAHARKIVGKTPIPDFLLVDEDF